jgi:hypothetical protein
LQNEFTISDWFFKEKVMTTRLPFIDRIKVLFRADMQGKQFILSRPQNYEVEILPACIARSGKHASLFGGNATKQRGQL